jgi:hypothetical protein
MVPFAPETKLISQFSEFWDVFYIFAELLPYYPLIFGITGLICGLVVAIKYGTGNVELQAKTKLNQGIHKSMKNAIVFGFIIWLIVTLALVFFSALQNIQLPSIDMFVVDGFLALPVGLIGLITGGQAVINHYALRFIFYLNHQIAWNYIPFLDHCVDLIFLRRVGGGYIFVHRLLMEHFAAMYHAEGT